MRVKSQKNEIERKREELITCAVLQYQDEELSLFDDFLNEANSKIYKVSLNALEDFYELKVDILTEQYQEFIEELVVATDIEIEGLYARVFGN